MKPFLIIRADTETRIGTGHVMRCLALAQAWQDSGGQVGFAMAIGVPALETRLKSEGIEIFKITTQPGSINDAVQTVNLAERMGANWVVVDGYHFDSTYQRKIKDSGHQLMVVDDMAHLDHYYADIVLNQNIHAESLKYFFESYTKLLLGTKYVLLRREFMKWRGRSREVPDVASKVLVTLGGSDPDNVTLKVIQALQKGGIPDLEVKIVVGPSNPHVKSLKDIMLSTPCSMLILEDVNNMPELMAWSDLAVSGGGSTSWELAYMGVPSVVLVVAQDQRVIAEELGKMGVVSNLGWHEQVSSSQVAQAIRQLSLSVKTRKRMASGGQDLIDCEGAERILMYMKGEKVRLRKLRKEDSKLIWKLSNDPEVRRVSFSSDPISWEDHVKWFQSKFNDPKCIFYIPVNHEDTPIGQVRFDIKNHEAGISISLDKRFRAMGYGVKVIQLSSERLFESSNVTVIHAYVRIENEMSRRTFLKAGFVKRENTKVNNQQAIHLILR